MSVGGGTFLRGENGTDGLGAGGHPLTNQTHGVGGSHSGSKIVSYLMGRAISGGREKREVGLPA